MNLLVNVAVPKNYVQTLRSLYFIQSKIRNISFWLEPFRWCCQRNNFFQLLPNKLIKMSSLYWIPVFMNISLVFRLWAFASSFILGSFILLSTPPTIWMGGLAETCSGNVKKEKLFYLHSESVLNSVLFMISIWFLGILTSKDPDYPNWCKRLERFSSCWT